MRQGPPPLCKLGRSFDDPIGLFGQKIGPNLSEDLFFSLHLIFGQKIRLILGETIYILIYVLKFTEVPAPPPTFLKSCVRYWVVEWFIFSKVASLPATRLLLLRRYRYLKSSGSGSAATTVARYCPNLPKKEKNLG